MMMMKSSSVCLFVCCVLCVLFWRQLFPLFFLFGCLFFCNTLVQTFTPPLSLKTYSKLFNLATAAAAAAVMAIIKLHLLSCTVLCTAANGSGWLFVWNCPYFCCCLFLLEFSHFGWGLLFEFILPVFSFKVFLSILFFSSCCSSCCGFPLSLPFKVVSKSSNAQVGRKGKGKGKRR